MMKVLTKAAMVTIVAIAINAVLCAGPAQAVEIDWPEPNWPEIFEPNQLLTLNLEMGAADWAFIVREVSPTVDPKTYTDKPAWFWMDGEDANKIVVAVRKKSCVMLPEPGYTIPGDANLIDPNKVKISIKIDINKYYCDPCTENCDLDPNYDPNAATDWHDLKKVSLENGGLLQGVQEEGIACNIHQLASAPEGYGYDSWRASWVKLYINNDYKGVYVSNEQIDKQFLRHRDLYVSHASWLYKSWGSSSAELKVGDEDFPMSPAYQALCYRPFPCLEPNSIIYLSPCSGPNDVNLLNDVNTWVNRKGLLSLGGVNSYLANHDALYGANGHNFYCLDWDLDDPCETRKRRYFPWDNDGSFADPYYGIYEDSETAATNTYAGLILGHPTLRSQANQILKDLINGPLSEDKIHTFIDDVNTAALRAAIIADPWNQVGGNPVGKFVELKDWISQRNPDVLAQIDFDEPELPPGIVLLDDGFDDQVDGDAWDARWDGIAHNWLADTGNFSHGRPSAHADKYNYGYFTCDSLDANDATAIHIDFKFKKVNTKPGEFQLSYYNGTGYVDVCDLDAHGADNVWLDYNDTITDSNYFVPDFQIRFNAALGGGGAPRKVWIDDVVVTKEVPVTISGTILDPGSAAVVGVAVDANNAGGSDTSDPSGYYELQVPYNWSGTATPTKANYTISSTYRSYSSVTTDQTNQDYTATSIYDLYPDGVIDGLDLDVFCEDWLSPAAEADYNDDGIVDFSDFAEFALAW